MGKKKGSSILTVMLASMLLTVMATLVGSAIVFNTTGNAVTKENNDLLYAAESGVDRGVSDIYKAEKIGSTPSSTPYNISDFQATYGITVNIKISKIIIPASTSYYYEVKSIATNSKGKSRTVTGKIKKELKYGDLFSKLACGEEVVVGSGSLNIGEGDVNSTNTLPSITGGSVDNPYQITDAEFTVPIYKFEKMTATSGETVINAANSSQLITQLNTLSGVRKITFKPFGIKVDPTTLEIVDDNVPDATDFDVYLINADNLKINITSPASFSRKIFLCSGNIKITSPGINTTHSTFIGKKVELPGSGANIMTYAPYIPKTHPKANVFKLNSVLGDKDLIYINQQINSFASNWGEGLNAGSGMDYWSVVSYEYN